MNKHIHVLFHFLFFCSLLLLTSCSTTMQAGKALSLQDFDEAITLYGQELEQNPANWRAGIRLGYALYRQEKYTEAIPVLLQYAEFSKEANGYGKFWAGLCAVALEQPELVVTCWNSWTPVSKHSYFTMEAMQNFNKAPYQLGIKAVQQYIKSMELAHAKDILLTEGNEYSGFYSVFDVPDTIHTMPKNYLP